ncbi:MAG: Crp/Fnr family transcriptional regulator [Desulfobacterales bacterium]|nr:Crp/Fnr family transcriptional regulator [Desulfobacterales bacterium]
MFIKQAELFWNLSHEFVKKVMDKVEKESFDKGHLIFSEGDPAIYFYTLIKGRVKLRVGKAGISVFIVNHAGDSFGWSSLVARDVYSASAECIEPTTVIKVNRKVLEEIISEYPNDGLVFMKRLAALLGQRLLWSYEMVSSSMKAGDHRSFGTGQVLETIAEE